MIDDRIAVVIPAYNAERFLPALFAALRAQTVPFDQVIVCDDASTDASAAMALQLGAQLVRHETNAGCSAAKNTGFARVTCAWVHFHDVDDDFGIEFVARAKQRIRDQGNDFDVLLYDVEQRHGESHVSMSRTHLAKSDLLMDPERYMLGHTVNNCGIYRRALVEKVGAFAGGHDVLFNEDREFHLRLAMRGARFAIEDYIGYITLWFAGSMSQGNQLRCLRATKAVTEHYVEQVPGRNSDVAASALWHVAAGLAAYDDMPSAVASVRTAMRLGHHVPVQGSALFRTLCHIHPGFALRFRERLIRWFKPHLRRHLQDAQKR